MSASRKLKRRVERDRTIIRISLPLPPDIQPWEVPLLIPHLQALLESMLLEDPDDDDEQGDP